MRSKIIIGSQEMTLQASSFTIFAYKNRYGRNLMQDLSQISNWLNQLTESEEEQAETLCKLAELMLKVTYVMYEEANKEPLPFDEWLKGLDDLMGDSSWMKEVYALAYSIFRRGVLAG